MKKRRASASKFQGTEITILSREQGDYVSLTDMVKRFEGGGALIEQWLKNKDTVPFLGSGNSSTTQIFNSLRLGELKRGRPCFFLSARSGSTSLGDAGSSPAPDATGGTYAHRDIAFEFGSWLSPEFKFFYLIRNSSASRTTREPPPIAGVESQSYALEAQHRIHTDAIKGAPHSGGGHVSPGGHQDTPARPTC